MFSEWWFSPLCVLAAGLLAAFTVTEYRLAAKVVFFEFLLHEAVYYFGIVQTDILDSAFLYAAYMAIQVAALYFMYKFQTHFIISALLFLNLLFNFVMVVQYINVATMDTYNNYLVALDGYRAAKIIWINTVGVVMLFELLYLLGMNRYVANYTRKHGPIKRGDIDYLDRLFIVRRDILGGDMV